MCGIAGIITPHSSDINSNLLNCMSDSLLHRGPDGNGCWINSKNNAGFVHRRLAIIDLSNNAQQPMHYLDRYTIVFNGEIFNYIELKKDLQKAGYYFKSHSDTEVILAAYDCYKEKCLQYFDGMFAFAIWDETTQTLFAARDRFGEKPFYYCKENDKFIFGSEMKAIWASGVKKEIEPRMLVNYLALGYLQHPSDKSQTFYSNIYSLPPAHYLYLKQNKIQISSYWKLDKQTIINTTEGEAIEKINQLLEQSVARRLRSDVKVGINLSGGLDSSTLLYYSKKHTTDITAFTAVFPGFQKDESKYVKTIVDQYNIRSLTVSPNSLGLISHFEKLCYHQEEPFSSSSVYAQYCVYQLAKENNIKVVMDGQGADEVFAGYHKYIHWFLQELISRYKFSKFNFESRQLHKNKVPYKWGIKNYIAAFLPSHVSLALEKKTYNQIVNHPDLSKHFLSSLKGREWEGLHKPVITKLNDSLYFDVMEMGLETLLRYADRNAMAHGCEARLPFLNHELVQYIFSLPTSFKIKDGFTKSILRKTMNGNLSDEIVWRKDKVGFEPPQKQWMGDATMKEYLHESKKVLVKNDILKPSSLQKNHTVLDAHEAKNYDWRYLCAARMFGK